MRAACRTRATPRKDTRLLTDEWEAPNPKPLLRSVRAGPLGVCTSSSPTTRTQTLYLQQQRGNPPVPGAVLIAQPKLRIQPQPARSARGNPAVQWQMAPRSVLQLRLSLCILRRTRQFARKTKSCGTARGMKSARLIRSIPALGPRLRMVQRQSFRKIKRQRDFEQEALHFAQQFAMDMQPIPTMPLGQF